MHNIANYSRLFLLGAMTSSVLLLQSVQAQVLTHGLANNGPNPAQVQAFCARYAKAKAEYKKQYLAQYRQYCAKPQPSVAKPTGLTQPLTATIKPAKPTIRQLWLPKCLKKGSRIRVTGAQFSAGKVICAMQPDLALRAGAQSISSLQLSVTGTPQAGTAYSLRCRAGQQSISSRRVNTCRQQPAVSAAVSSKARLPVDLTGTLLLLPPLASGQGAQQRVKVVYRNQDQGRVRGTFDLEIFLSASKPDNTQRISGQLFMPGDRKPLVLSRIAGNTVPAGGMQQIKLVNVSLPRDYVSGSYNWCVRLDAGHQIRESNENNNTYCIEPGKSLTAPRLLVPGVTGVFGARLRNRPLTGPDGKSLLGPQVDLSQVHLLDDESATPVGTVAVPVHDTIGPDLVITDLSLDPSRRKILVRWREAHRRPLPAGEFDWVVELKGSHMASIDRIRDAVQSLRNIYSKNPFSQSPATEVEIPTKLARRLEPYRIRGRAQVSAGALSGYFEAAFDLYAGVLQDQRYLTVKAELNQNGNYPESSLSNDVLVKQLPYSGHSGSAPGVEGETPSQIFSIQSWPALGNEHVMVHYSLAGILPGRLGIFWGSRGAITLVDCYPNGGDGLASVGSGLNRQIEFVCVQPQRQFGRPAEQPATISAELYNGSGRVVDRFSSHSILHFTSDRPATARHPDLAVQIIDAYRVPDGKPRVYVRVRNEGNAPSATASIAVTTSYPDAGACRWPHGRSEPVPALLPGQFTTVMLEGDLCHGEPGTYRTGRQYEHMVLFARITPDGDDLNAENNLSTQLLVNALGILHDSPPSASLATRVNRAVLMNPTSQALTYPHCRNSTLHVRIQGGPFNRERITAEIGVATLSERHGRERNDASLQSVHSLPVRILSDQQLDVVIPGCDFTEFGILGGIPMIRLHYVAGHRSSGWINIRNGS